jgi:TetR/AcrR family transcriptional regulator
MENKNTEQKIVEAAEKEFVENGFAGARMQEIANKAGINKALLHYYFRSKQKLFEMVFKTAFRLFIPKILGIFNREDIDFFEKIRLFVSAYIDLVIRNPYIPGFILHELNRQPSAILATLEDIKPDMSPVLNIIQEEMDKGNIGEFDPKQLVINTLSLSVFPIIAAPMVKLILFDGDNDRYQKLIEERKKHVAEFIILAITHPDKISK